MRRTGVKRYRKKERKKLRTMDAKGDGCGGRVREFMGLGLIVPVHVRVHSWGKKGKWGTDVLYQTQRPELQ